MPIPELPPTSLAVISWDDPIVDELGHDPRSPYVERFWLGILGPSTTWLVRHLVARLDEEPQGFPLDLVSTAALLGLGSRGGRNAPLIRSLARCCQFGVAVFSGRDTLAVRRRLPPLTEHQVHKLPPQLRQEHERWTQPQRIDTSAMTTISPEQQRDRCERLALSLAELGEDVESIERHLHRWRFHPAMTHQAAVRAHTQVAAARAAQPLTDLGGDAA